MSTAELSPLFTTLADPDDKTELHLSDQQRDLARQLDELTRDLIRAWLIRDLDADHPPKLALLSERLSERGDRLRDRVIAHAEAIALDGILTPEQAHVNGPEPLRSY